MTQSFSMGVRQRRDVRNRSVPLISDERAVLGALGSTEPESMKVLAYNLQQVGVVSATAPAPESVRDRRAASRVGCEGASTDAPHVLALPSLKQLMVFSCFTGPFSPPSFFSPFGDLAS